MPRPKHTVAYRERLQRKRRAQRERGYAKRWNIFHGRQPNDDGCLIGFGSSIALTYSTRT